MRFFAVKLISPIVVVVVVAGGLFAPVSYAAEKKLTLRERLAISKAIDSYAKTDRSKSACWRYSKATSLENGVRTAVVTAKKTSANKKTCPSVKAVQGKGQRQLNVEFSPSTGWQVIDQTTRVTKPFPVGAGSPLPLGSRLIPYGDNLYSNTYDVYAPFRGESRTQFGGESVSGQGDIQVDAGAFSYKKWYAAYSIPPTCSSATATFSSRLQSFGFAKKGELSGYIKAIATNGQVLGYTDLPRMSLANEPADGPSGSLTIPIDPLNGATVIIETNFVDSGSTIPPKAVKTLSVSGNCALSIVSNRVVLNSATESEDTVRVTGVIEAQYSDGEWRPAPQGDVAKLGRELFTIGSNGTFSVDVRSLFAFRESVAYRGAASPLINCNNGRCKY